MPTKKTTKRNVTKAKVSKKTTRKTSKNTTKTKTDQVETSPKSTRPAKVDYTRFRFITDESGLDTRYIQLLDKNTDESSTIDKLDKIINDEEKSEKMAKGIFEATLLKCIENNPAPTIALSIYDELCVSMVNNLNHKSKVGNYSLLMKVKGKTFDPYEVPFMSPDEIFKENWELQERKKAYALAKQNEIEMTDAFTCHKCGEKKCKVQQMQTRAADEPMTNIITCKVCGNVFYK